ncbi:hypothetical protein HYV43_01540 [Candidatus Micrarchaeota archaeon]|nr:hypothetical protein [Candidatus Micrarchaeota archaeon]
MVADELHDALSNRTIWVFALVVGSLLLFGAWDTQTILIGLVIAAAVVVYLVRYQSIDLQWET